MISSIKFTLREVDVIACIVHNRGYKKIASLMQVSHRTIHTHVRNINAKIRSNSREGIIDFVEGSEQQRIISIYYSLLLFDYKFKAKLKELFSDSCLSCSLFLFPKSLENIKIIKHIASTIPFIDITFCEKKSPHKIHAFISDIKNKKSLSSKYINNKKKIFLIFDSCTEKVKISSDIKYIYFTEEYNYYSNIIILLESLYGKIITEPFLDKVKNQPINSIALNLKTKGKLKSYNKLPFFDKYNKIKLASFFAFIVSLLVLLLILVKNKTEIDIKTKLPERILSTIKSGSNIVYNQNSDQDQLNKNLIESIALRKNITLIDRKIISKYFSNNIDTSLLTLYLYDVYITATFHNFNYKNIKESQGLLLHSMVIVENFLRLTNSTINNLDKLEFDELVTELSVVKHLPELYTKIIYTLACTYMHLDDNKNAIKYFNLSKNLGERFNLFEGFLSKRNGLIHIELNKVLCELDHKNKKNTEEKILKIIDLYKDCLYTKKEFIINYQPIDKNKNIIIPVTDIKNNVICKQQIIKCYTKLILITNNTKEQKYLLDNIKIELFGHESKQGTLSFYDNLDKRHKALFCNEIADFLLKMFINNIEVSDIIEKLNKKFNTDSFNIETLIKDLFNKAKNHLRSNDIGRLKSYDGLINLYKFYIKSNTLTEPQKKTLLTNLLVLNRAKTECITP
jgi:DNA-binding CsgD family transcriptional regulator